MAHRTLNPYTRFYGDMREAARSSILSRKKALAVDAWMIAYPGERMPYRARDVYADLRVAGFTWNGSAWNLLIPITDDVIDKEK